MIGEPGMRRSVSSKSHQPSVRPKVSVKKSVFAESSFATSRPPLRSRALHCCSVLLMLRVACSTFVAKRMSYSPTEYPCTVTQHVMCKLTAMAADAQCGIFFQSKRKCKDLDDQDIKASRPLSRGEPYLARTWPIRSGSCLHTYNVTLCISHLVLNALLDIKLLEDYKGVLLPIGLLTIGNQLLGQVGVGQLHTVSQISQCSHHYHRGAPAARSHLNYAHLPPLRKVLQRSNTIITSVNAVGDTSIHVSSARGAMTTAEVPPVPEPNSTTQTLLPSRRPCS